MEKADSVNKEIDMIEATHSEHVMGKRASTPPMRKTTVKHSKVISATPKTLPTKSDDFIDAPHKARVINGAHLA